VPGAAAGRITGILSTIGAFIRPIVPEQKWHYADRTDVPMLAAAYAFELVQNHPYRDGNKRVGFLAMVTFLGVNGHDFSATDAEVVTEFLALADGTLSEEALADWIRRY
jgi:death-on-curing protein